MLRMKRDGASGEGPPNWMVAFWVPNADAAVEKAKKLGGRVVVPLFDIPRFRQAILADPQGAVFTVSQPKREGQCGSFMPPARSTSRRSRCQRLAFSSA
jgi:predicted enzyme related to lactoylglutathione lyase